MLRIPTTACVFSFSRSLLSSAMEIIPLSFGWLLFIYLLSRLLVLLMSFFSCFWIFSDYLCVLLAFFCCIFSLSVLMHLVSSAMCLFLRNLGSSVVWCGCDLVAVAMCPRSATPKSGRCFNSKRSKQGFSKQGPQQGPTTIP